MGEKFTAHRAAEEQLQLTDLQLESSHRFSQIEKAIHDMFYVIDMASGESTYTSHAFETIFGRNSQDVCDQKAWMSCIHADDKDMVCESRQRVIEMHKEADIAYRIVRPGGAVRFVRDQFFADRQTNELVGVVHDHTEKSSLEIRLRHAQKMQSLGTLAGGIAHDFNNLLMGVAGYLHLAANQLGPNHAALHSIERGLRAVLRGASLAQQLVTFGDDRQQGAKPLILDEVVIEASHLLKRLVGDHVRIEIETKAPNIKILADAGEVEQFLMNLASNARDAMPDGGTLTLQTGTTRNTIKGSDDTEKSFATIAVTDTGIGMSDETRAHVFDPFFTTKEFGKGTGLGLSTVLSVVSRLNGYMTIDSEIRKGTTITVALPTLAEKENAQLTPPTSALNEGNGETILLLDDDDDVREAVTCFLETLQYKVLAARTANEATTLCQHHRDEIRLLVCDVMMPDILGSALAPRLQMAHGRLPVVYISAHDPAELITRGYVKEGDRLLRKPFDLPRFAKIISGALSDAGPY